MPSRGSAMNLVVDRAHNKSVVLHSNRKPLEIAPSDVAIVKVPDEQKMSAA